MPMKNSPSDKLDAIVAQAHKNRVSREQGYREKAIKMYPWVCGRCAREFDRSNLKELTVHHRDHDHDNNPEDGSNWELLCVYCHDNEHSRLLDANTGSTNTDNSKTTTYKALAGLSSLIKTKP